MESEEYIRKEARRIITNGDVPVILGVSDLDGNFLGYKADSCWTCSEKYSKVHPLKDASKKGHLIANLLYFYNYEDSEAKKGSWLERFAAGCRVSVESIRDGDAGKVLATYEIVKKGDNYVLN